MSCLYYFRSLLCDTPVMNNDTIEKLPSRITSERLEPLDDRSVEYCINEGNRYIDSQVQIGNEIRSKCFSFLGIIAAAIVTLSGTSIVLINRFEYDSILFFLNLYALMSLCIVSFKLIRGVIYERSCKIAGNKPNYILCDSALSYAQRHADAFYKHLLGVHLNTLIEKIEFNKKENERMQQCFKSCIQLTGIFILLVIPIILFYWITR